MGTFDRVLRTRGTTILQPLRRPLPHRIQQIPHSPLIPRNHPLKHSPPCPRPPRDQHLLKNRRSRRHHMRLLRQPIHQSRPVPNPIIRDPLQTDMRSRPQQPLLQILPKPVIDGQSHDQRSHSRRHSNNRDARDDPNKRLPPLGAQIASRDEKFKAHEEAFSCQLSAFSHDYGLYGARGSPTRSRSPLSLVESLSSSAFILLAGRLDTRSR